MPQDALQKTAATQPFPVGADSALPTCDAWKKQSLPRGFELGCDYYTPASVQKPNLLTPNFGMRVAPMAFSPDTGYFYATGNASLGWLRRAENPWFFSNTFNQRVPGLNSSRPRRARGDRQPHQQGRVEEGVQARTAERRDDDGWRIDVPVGARR